MVLFLVLFHPSLLHLSLISNPFGTLNCCFLQTSSSFVSVFLHLDKFIILCFKQEKTFKESSKKRTQQKQSLSFSIQMVLLPTFWLFDGFKDDILMMIAYFCLQTKFAYNFYTIFWLKFIYLCFYKTNLSFQLSMAINFKYYGNLFFGIDHWMVTIQQCIYWTSSGINDSQRATSCESAFFSLNYFVFNLKFKMFIWAFFVCRLYVIKL